MNIDKNIGKNSALLEGKGIPEFKKITDKEIKLYMPKLLDQVENEFLLLEEKLATAIESKSQLDWDNVITPLYDIEEKLRWSWSAVTHLNSVCNSPELREQYSIHQPNIIRIGNRIGQSKILFQALSILSNRKPNNLNPIQQRILETEILSMKHRGVGLDGITQKEFNLDSERLGKLSNVFSNNVLDATKEWSLLLTKPSEVSGLPQRALESFASSAKKHGVLNSQDNSEPTAEKGPWRIGLDAPSYLTFMNHASNRSLREIVYKAYISKASTGKLSNQKIIEEILTLRNKQANRIGYNNWAKLSLAKKMAKDLESVEHLLEELRLAALPAAEKELKEMQECAAKYGAPESLGLSPWDIYYWAEQLKKEKYNLNQEFLRSWFPLPQVLEGLFNLCNKLFDISIETADGEAPIWHEDVRFFKVIDNNQSVIAYFFLDPYSRPSTKRGGAWMDECLTRQKHINGETTLPVAYLICNQTPPIDETPSLMSFDEVETLFHEFGHGLQHMLTKVDYPQAAGINNVEWDAVELPSQFMENWCINRSTLFDIAKHWETGAPLPEEEFNKLKASRTFNSGLSTLRQVHFALTDLKLHSDWDSSIDKTPDELRREIAKQTTVIPPIQEDQFLCSFSHIFAGGYSAGYYSYKWSEVLSADAFSAFEEEGLNNEAKIKATGRRFRETVLSLGGSMSPTKVFKLFRGRAAKTDALIRHSGLLTN